MTRLPHAERNISDKYLLSDACHGRIQRGDRGSGPLKNHKNIGFPSNIDPDPLKITKLSSQHSMVCHYRQWRFADGPMVVHLVAFRSSLTTPSDKMFWIHACIKCVRTGSIEIKLSTDIIHARIQKALSEGIQL